MGTGREAGLHSGRGRGEAEIYPPGLPDQRAYAPHGGVSRNRPCTDYLQRGACPFKYQRTALSPLVQLLILCETKGSEKALFTYSLRLQRRDSVQGLRILYLKRDASAYPPTFLGPHESLDC